MELIPALFGVLDKLETPLAWAVLFVVTLFMSQRYFGDWFKLARDSAAGQADAQSKTNTTMLAFIERLNNEIKRLSESETAMMARLNECEKRHRARDQEFEALQNEVAQLQVKLFSIGLGNVPQRTSGGAS